MLSSPRNVEPKYLEMKDESQAGLAWPRGRTHDTDARCFSWNRFLLQFVLDCCSGLGTSQRRKKWSCCNEIEKVGQGQGKAEGRQTYSADARFSSGGAYTLVYSYCLTAKFSVACNRNMLVVGSTHLFSTAAVAGSGTFQNDDKLSWLTLVYDERWGLHLQCIRTV